MCHKSIYAAVEDAIIHDRPKLSFASEKPKKKKWHCVKFFTDVRLSAFSPFLAKFQGEAGLENSHRRTENYRQSV
ncbi:MAG TPA: hypothetical protein VGO47_07350, partial [Chlamydiales bacterium]|nr:hypothetical protein [Chlamydiales bacterium]